MAQVAETRPADAPSALAVAYVLVVLVVRRLRHG
jgi:hypothetical protein